MSTAALVIALIGSSISVAQQGVLFWRIVKTPPMAVHHHVIKPFYHHVLKPIGHNL